MRGNTHSPVMGGRVGVGVGVGVGVAAGPISTFPIYTEGTPFIAIYKSFLMHVILGNRSLLTIRGKRLKNIRGNRHFI